MTSTKSGTIGIAFEILLEAIDKETRASVAEAVRAFEGQEFQRVTDALSRADLLTTFRSRVEAISKEWEEFAHGEPERAPESPAPVLENRCPLPSGDRTPRETYYALILSVLETMGGHGETAEVLDRVHEMVAPQLTDADREPLPSEPHMPRWRKSAQWARFDMVTMGLLKPNSPRGIWEITEQGRAYLRQHASSDASANAS